MAELWTVQALVHARVQLDHDSGREKAARQQGGFFFRENSSDGGKAI
ncbi:hypothetical protein [Terriglobus aquaticus]|uniref:Uncharacterized protein n=1 Tax=Terriglobus aquaticus TaxID=940139 RepID=A0ABW9KF86_9BACT|nr:hypothetical protein [Terriglobus aquaticus]